MINTRKISRDIKDAEAKEFDLRQKLNGSINAIKDLKAKKVKQENWWSQRKNSSGRYIDEYSGTDRTAEYKTVIQKINNDIQKQEEERVELSRKLLLQQSEVKKFKLNLVRARIDNKNEKKENLKNFGGKIKNGAKKAVSWMDSKNIEKGAMSVFNGMDKIYKSIRTEKNLGISPNDIVFRPALVKHAKEVFLGKKQLFGEEPSKLKSTTLTDERGMPTEQYEHYDKYTHTADIDLKTPYEYGTFEKDGVHMHTVKNVTVFLGENGQPDFSNPQNAGVLRNPKLLNSILEQYPKAIESIPASHILNLSKDARQDLASAYEKGIEDRRLCGDWGYDKDGNALSEQEFLEEATDRFNNKSKEANELKKAREGAQGYEFEQ